MSKTPRSIRQEGRTINEIKSLEDLINLNLNTLNGVVAESIDNKKAALIFTGSRTVTATMKLGIEAMKLGMKSIGGVSVGDSIKKIN